MYIDRVEGLIVGSKKCGTTWIYQNYILEHGIVVSEEVKESGYFVDNRISSIDEYHSLFNRADLSNEIMVEIDTSILYSDESVSRILSYNNNMRIAVILRDPVSYFMSRLKHCVRKGEISLNNIVSIDQLFSSYKWLSKELDYTTVNTFVNSFGEKCKVYAYEAMVQDSNLFYSEITRHLSNERICGACPEITGAVNKSRGSKFPFVTFLYTTIAKYLRGLGMNSVVQYFRDSKLRGLIESEEVQYNYPFSEMEVELYLKREFSQSFVIHNSIISNEDK